MEGGDTPSVGPSVVGEKEAETKKDDAGDQVVEDKSGESVEGVEIKEQSPGKETLDISESHMKEEQKPEEPQEAEKPPQLHPATSSASQEKIKDDEPESKVQEDDKEDPVTSNTPSSPPSPAHAPISPSEDATLFNRISYLGVTNIDAPRSNLEISRNMMVLNQEKGADGEAFDVSIKIPHHSSGAVVIFDAESWLEIREFPVAKILYCMPGPADSAQQACFAFTCIHGDEKDKESAVFQCHIFRCHIIEAVPKVMHCFQMAFKRGLRSSDAADGNGFSRPPSVENAVDTHVFEVALEIREEDNKGNFLAVPKDKNYFKLRCDTDKRVHMTVYEVAEPDSRRELAIERCFGLLISPGKHVKDGDMHLLEMVSNMELNSEGKQQLVIVGHWDSMDAALASLNLETQVSSLVSMSVAVDLVLQGIQQPVRFYIETGAKIYPKRERFWYAPRRQLVQQFALKIKPTTESPVDDDLRYEVVDLTSIGELDRSKPLMHLNLNTLSNLASSALAAAATATSGRSSLPETPNGFEDDSDWDDEDDEPLMSGAGEVSKECSEDRLKNWSEVLAQWKTQQQDFLPPLQAVVSKSSVANGSVVMSKRVRRSKIPRQLLAHVRDGIPEALRGAVWQRLAGCDMDPAMLDNYRLLIAQSCPQEQAIERDINRTFPGHEFFKERRGPNDRGISGQEALLKVCKAISVYDKELGYCQGLSFLAAALLLHMPEEQAFALLVRILYDYGLRDLFVEDFHLLHVRFFQLDKLIQEHLPELAAHLRQEGVESHMFASQWFLTLFTAKFPLYLVFHILDLFLLCGLDTTFQVALALLSTAKRDLLALDFEGILRYFRIGLPRRYHKSEELGKQLIHLAGSFKLRKLDKYERQYCAIQEAARQEDPVDLLKGENHRLLQDNMRLEREIDVLVMEKIQLRSDLDSVEDRAETLAKKLNTAEEMLVDVEDDRKRIEVEAAQVKEMFKKEMMKWEQENARNLRIIDQYKTICSQLSQRLDNEQSGGSPVKSADGSQALGENSNHSSLNGETGASGDDAQQEPVNEAEAFFQRQIRELELSLAQTKLALVEAQCKNQDLSHQLATVTTELQGTPSRRDSWLQKTLSSLKEAARDITDKDDKV